MFILYTPAAQDRDWLHDAASVRFRGTWYVLEGAYHVPSRTLYLAVQGPAGQLSQDLEGVEVHTPYVGALGSFQGAWLTLTGVGFDPDLGEIPLRVIDPETGEDLQVRQDLE